MFETGAASVSASPNPASNSFRLSIRGTNDQPMQVRELNILGYVMEQRLNIVPYCTIITGSSYRTGIYFLDVVQGTERAVKKIVKE